MLQPLIIIVICILVEHISRISLGDFIKLSYNSGAAFGIFNNFPEVALILSCSVCLIIFFALAFLKLKPLLKIGLSIMLGGAISNLLERIFFGHVIDWIPFPFTFLFSDLNFNLADVEISLGALIAFLSYL